MTDKIWAGTSSATGKCASPPPDPDIVRLCENNYFTKMCSGSEAGSYLTETCRSSEDFRNVERFRGGLAFSSSSKLERVSAAGASDQVGGRGLADFFLFFTPVSGPRGSLSLKLSDARVYGPHIRARFGTIAELCEVVVLGGRSSQSGLQGEISRR